MKKSHYRFIKTVAAFFTIAVMSGFLSFAATGSIYFSDPEAKVGEQVNIVLTVDAGQTVLGRADITLSYPSDSLEFLEGHNCDGGAGIVRIHGNVEGGNVSKLEYAIAFKALKPGKSVIKVDSTEVYDSNEKEIQLSHVGTSTVTISPEGTASSNSDLSDLQVSPGTLTPVFSPEISDYSVTVGLDVNVLAIDAKTASDKATVRVSGNEELKEGENTVTVTVTAEDGNIVREYRIIVLKTAEGDNNVSENASSVSESQLTDGVQLSSKGKTITVMNLPDSSDVPAAFREGTISIDGSQVQGWVCTSDETSQPEYIVVYGMNDQGEMNFYRYDMQEKTIQRYFKDPQAANTVTVDEFNAVQTELNEKAKESQLRFVILCGLGVAVFALLLTVILLAVRLSAISREAMERERERLPENGNTDILKHGYSSKKNRSKSEDETVVITGKDKKEKKTEEINDATVVIKEKKPEKAEDTLDGFEEFKL